ncbi:Secreted protein OS=Streptomyces tendae OX=1932 GN=GUR47_31695 PE=4 SV=1 [Streptomyces tendae]
MSRATTARTALALLAAVLLVLTVFAPAPPFASAHTSRDAVANTHSGTTHSGTAAYDETVTCHDTGRPGNPNGSARARDRHRTTTAPQPDAPERSGTRQRGPAAPAPLTSALAAADRPRSAPDHSPAALQVFRC